MRRQAVLNPHIQLVFHGQSYKNFMRVDEVAQKADLWMLS